MKRLWTRFAAIVITAMIGALAGPASAQLFPPIPAEPIGGMPFDNVKCKWDGYLGKTRCLVNVRAEFVPAAPPVPARCDAKAPNVYLDTSDKKFIIIWQPTDAQGTPLPNDFRFCPLAGDGTYLKELPGSEDEQFDDTWTGDNAGVGSDPTKYKGKACFARSRMLAENSSAYTAKEYKYQVQFHHKASGLKCVADPFIKNG